MNYQEVIEKYGTPSYVFNIDELKKRIEYLKDKLSLKYDLVYAVKANTFISKEIENEVARYEICSPGEFDICNKLNILRNKMVISGVYKDRLTIENMIKNYDDILKYTIESISQYELLDELTTKYQRKINILIRLTSGNQFGVTVEEIKKIITDNHNPLITIDGIEFFSGTQKHSLKIISKEIDKLINLVDTIENEWNFKIKEIEYGPGLPVYYYQDDVFDEDEFLKEVKNILDKIKNHKVTLELGRSIAASCGSYLTKVVDMKSNKFANYAILDGGINHLVYYGQTMAIKVPYFEIWPRRTADLVNYSLCGSLCTINDFLVKNINVRKLEKNDVFIFKNVGAYSCTEGISLFLSRDLPKVILYQNEKFKLVRENVKTSELNFPKNL